MKKQYTEMSVYVAGADLEDHLILATNTLDGMPGVVEIKRENGKDDPESLGYYNIDQLIDALNAIKNCNFEFTESKE